MSDLRVLAPMVAAAAAVAMGRSRVSLAEIRIAFDTYPNSDKLEAGFGFLPVGFDDIRGGGLQEGLAMGSPVASHGNNARVKHWSSLMFVVMMSSATGHIFEAGCASVHPRKG
jgi:hypothetical protein